MQRNAFLLRPYTYVRICKNMQNKVELFYYFGHDYYIFIYCTVDGENEIFGYTQNPLFNYKM